MNIFNKQYSPKIKFNNQTENFDNVIHQLEAAKLNYALIVREKTLGNDTTRGSACSIQLRDAKHLIDEIIENL